MTSIKYRPDLQGLRAIAVLIVILNHAEFLFFSGGFIGVDVFFVLSGYLISGLLINEYRSKGNIQFLAFISRRLKRLLPALALMLSITVIISPFLISSQELDQQFRSAFFAASWTSNLFFAFSKLDYFSELQTRDFFLHTWSLGVEEQFYIVWPLLLVVMFGWLSKGQGCEKSNNKLLWFFLFLFISSLFLCIFWSRNHPLWAFYLMPSRIWQFALGASIFVWEEKLTKYTNDANTKPSNSLFKCFGILGLGLIIGSGLLLNEKMVYPGFWALIPSFGAALVIAAGVNNTDLFPYRLLSNPILVWVGDRSYSWYLWHWPILMYGFAWGAQNHLIAVLALIFLSLGTAALSYRFVELPFWKGKFSFAAPAKILLVSILTIALLVIGTLKLFNFVSNEFGVRSIPYNNARGDVPAIYYAYPEGCDSWYANANVQPCIIGNNEASRTVVLIGDSVGVMWVSMLPEIFKSPGWRVVVLTKSACPMVDREFYYERIKSTYTVCTEWRKSAIDYLKSLHPEIIVVGSSSTYSFSKEDWVEGSKSVLSQLTNITKNILIIPGTPTLSFDGPSCLSRWNADGPGLVVRWLANKGIKILHSENFSCNEKVNMQLYDNVNRYLKETAQNYSNVHLLELNDLVCPSDICSAQDSRGVIVFRDGRHLTNSFVISRVPNVINKIKILGLKDYIE